MNRRSIGFVEPCRTSAAQKPPSGLGWLHEIKHDGYRMMARRDGKSVQAFTRNGDDWSELFPALVTAVEQLGLNSCLIDGGIVVCDEQGSAVFDPAAAGQPNHARGTL